MSVLVHVLVERRPVDRVEADVLIAGIFSDERPARGAAGRVDWRLCGPVSQSQLSGRLEGEPGDVVLLTTFGKLQVPRVLLLGLGERARFATMDVKKWTREAVGRAIELGARRLVLEPLGVADAEFPHHADAVLSASLEAARAFEAQILLRLLLREDDRVQTDAALRAAVSGAKRATVKLVSDKPKPVSRAVSAGVPSTAP